MNVVRFERLGTSYVGYDPSGKAVALVTEVKSINTASRRVKRSISLSGGLK